MAALPPGKWVKKILRTIDVGHYLTDCTALKMSSVDENFEENI